MNNNQQENKIMQEIVTALLTGQRSVMVQGVEMDLKPLPRDTAQRREKAAKKRAKELLEILRS